MPYLAQIDIKNDFLGPGHILNNLSGVGNVVSLILNISFVAAGVILLFFIVIGGFGLITSAGQNNPEKLEKGKQTVTSALIGFIVVFVAYWIVKLIEQITGLNLLGQ